MPKKKSVFCVLNVATDRLVDRLVEEQPTLILVSEQAGAAACHATSGVAAVAAGVGDLGAVVGGGHRGCDHCT